MAKKTTNAKTTARKSQSGKKAPSRKTKPSSTKSKSTRKKTGTAEKPAGAEEVTIDRRRPAGLQADAAEGPSEGSNPPLERRKKVNRRRQIDPTTCERDYTNDEIEFMNALNEYKRKSGRMFPTCSEVLEVIRELGYVKLTPSELAAQSPAPESADVAPTSEEVAADQCEVIAETQH